LVEKGTKDRGVGRKKRGALVPFEVEKNKKGRGDCTFNGDGSEIGGKGGLVKKKNFGAGNDTKKHASMADFELSKRKK